MLQRVKQFFCHHENLKKVAIDIHVLEEVSQIKTSTKCQECYKIFSIEIFGYGMNTTVISNDRGLEVKSHLPRCKINQKVTYSSEKLAREVINRIKKTGRKKIPKRVYFCGSCRGHHLTSK